MPLTIPPYEGQGWTDNSTPDLSAETLNAVDDGIAAVTNGVNAIAAAVVSQIINDPEKIASIAVAYAQQQQINTINTNLSGKIDANRIRIVSGILNDTTANQAFTISGTRTVPSYLLSAQIQLSAGVWTDMASVEGITRIDNNTTQVAVIRASATTLAGYQVRFVFLD